MTPIAPPPLSPGTRTRIKWDNVAVVGFGVVLATFAVVAVLISSAPATEPAATSTPEPAAAPAALDAATAPVQSPDSLTMEDAQGLVEDARSLIGEGRWDEAADRLDTVPEEYRSATGADELAGKLSTLRAEDRTLRSQLDAAVEARQWSDARDLLRRLARIAPLDAALVEVKDLVDEALARPAQGDRPTRAKERDQAKDRPTTGGGATSGRPAQAATGARPAASGSTRPAASGGTRPAGGGNAGRPAGTRPAGAATGAARPPAGSAAAPLTPAEQQQLEEALAQALADAGIG